jgi:hypothetical protein
MRDNCTGYTTDSRGGWCTRYHWRIDGVKTNCDRCTLFVPRGGRAVTPILPVKEEKKKKEEAREKKPTSKRGGRVKL